MAERRRAASVDDEEKEEEMISRLANDVAVVTGGASGIGREIAITLAANGAAVACFDINAKGLEETVASIKEKGGQAIAVTVDLSESGQLRDAMKNVADTFGGISILINCAAMTDFTPFPEISDELWFKVMKVNVASYFFCLREAYPYLKKSGNARVVLFSSSNGFSGSGYASVPYSTSKAAAVGLTKSMAGICGRDGIRVNAICPGLTETPMTHVGGETRRKDAYQNVIPLGRIACPADMANVTLFLASEESGYMTGEVLHVNGGKYMYHL